MRGPDRSRRLEGPWLVALALVVLAALWLRLRAFSPYEIGYADEFMQYLEQAKRIASGQGIQPWEYRYGARGSLIAQVLAGPWWLGWKLAPGLEGAMLAARWAFVALTLIALPAAWRLGRLTSPAHGLAALAVVGLWYESVLLSTLLLSEVLGAALLLAGAALLLDPAPTRARLRWAGLLLGLGVVARLQYAPFAAVLVITALGRRWAPWWQVILGGLGAAAIGAASDLYAGRAPFMWILVNLHYNMAEGRAARFGAEGPWAYARMLLDHLGPATPLILAAACAVPARYRPLLWAALANLVFHSLIAHKEYRFIWASMLALLVLGAIGSVSLAQGLAARRGRVIPPLLGGALFALGWGAASLGAEHQSGGARVLRGGAPIPLAALKASRDPAVCGIAVPDQWRAHIATALLAREVRLYVAPKAVVAEAAPLPPGLVASADALVFKARPAGAEAYQLRGCKANTVLTACLYVRPGKCRIDPTWSYQSALEREDL
ncbi:MAG: hypothetical protein JSS36_10365 [Proteobacteria bacterium]|nr:hypothetical protein [Pseudomonadota bacterium]